MAYLDISHGYDIGAVAGTAMAVPDRAVLSRLEWSVVALARQDRLSSVSEPGRISVAMGKLFGRRRQPELADPKLEALRRIVVFARHYGRAIPARERHAFLAAGFTPPQYERVCAVAGGRPNVINQ